MKNNTIEDIKEYAKDSQTKQEPTEQNYAEGVKVGWTLPAKWWNWLMNAFTKRFRETKATVDSMYEELSNLMWPFVPGENETNDQCKRRIHGSMSELSEQIDTNTGNISANATAINTEKQARISAIEQEQIARTNQDNVLDGKITSLSGTVSANTSKIEENTTAITNETAARKAEDTAIRSLITQTQAEIYNSIITHNIYRTDEVDWTTLFNDLKNKGCPTGLHIGDIVYTVNSYNGQKCVFLVVDINYCRYMIDTRYNAGLEPLSHNHIILMSIENLGRTYGSEANYASSNIYSQLKNPSNPFTNAITNEIDPKFLDNSIRAIVQYSPDDIAYLDIPIPACNCSIAQLIGMDLQGLTDISGDIATYFSFAHANSFNRQFKLFKEEGFLTYRNALQKTRAIYSSEPVPFRISIFSMNVSKDSINSNTYSLGTKVASSYGSNTELYSAVSLYEASLSDIGYYPEFYILGKWEKPE